MHESILRNHDSRLEGDNVDLQSDVEIERRCQEWGCTRVQLKIAAKGVNSAVAARIEYYLRAQGWHK
jgi:hypothetical protein